MVVSNSAGAAVVVLCWRRGGAGVATESFEGPGGGALDGAGGPSEFLGDLRFRHVIEVAQHDHGSLVSRQRAQEPDVYKRQNIETGPLFLTRTGSRPTQSNWSRSLVRACSIVEWPYPLTPYGPRRTNASHLAQSIPIAEAAARLGHSVEILTKHYVKRVAGQVALSNEILDNLYSVDLQLSARLSSHSSSAER